MGKFEKVLHRVLNGEADANVEFADLCWLLQKLAFHERVRGSHHVYGRSELKDGLNLQPRRDGKAKEYQVKQVRDALRVILREEGSND